MPLENRVDRWGRFDAVTARGELMGNRGNLQRLRQQWERTRWITCTLTFPGSEHVPPTPCKYTKLFFLDEATAFFLLGTAPARSAAATSSTNSSLPGLRPTSKTRPNHPTLGRWTKEFTLTASQKMVTKSRTKRPQLNCHKAPSSRLTRLHFWCGVALCYRGHSTDMVQRATSCRLPPSSEC